MNHHPTSSTSTRDAETMDGKAISIEPPTDLEAPAAVTRPSPTGFAPALAFLHAIGAARADATIEQLEQLRDRIRPLVQPLRETGDTRPVLGMIRAVMGPEWEPSDEWRRAIDSLLAERPSEGETPCPS